MQDTNVVPAGLVTPTQEEVPVSILVTVDLVTTVLVQPEYVVAGVVTGAAGNGHCPVSDRFAERVPIEAWLHVVWLESPDGHVIPAAVLVY